MEAKNQTGQAIGDMGGQLDKLSGALMGAGFAFAGAQFAHAVIDLAQLGTQAERTEEGFQGLAGAKADEMLLRLRQASRGTIDDMQLMQSASRAMMLGVTDDAETMARLLEVAAVRGRAMGLSTAQAFDDLMRGIGRLSPLILDNLGILTGGQKTYDEYAASIGKTGDVLTDLEKRQALVNLVLKENVTLGDDAASSWERQQAAMSNLKVEVGLLLADLSTLAAVQAGATQATADYLRTARETRDLIGSYRNILEEQRQYLGLTRWEYEKLDIAVDAIAKRLAEGEITEKHAIELLNELLGVTRDYRSELQQMEPVLRAGSALHREMALSIGQHADAIERLSRPLDLFFETAGERLAYWGQQLGRAKIDSDEYYEALKQWEAAMGDVTKEGVKQDAALDRLTDVQFGYAMSLRDIPGQIRLIEDAQRELNRTTIEGQILWTQLETQRIGLIQTLSREEERLGEEHVRKMIQIRERAAAEIRGLVESVLQPTGVTEMDVLKTKLGLYTDKWDEAARRLEDIAAKGVKSPWAAQFEIPEGVLAQGPERIRLWALEMADAVRAGLQPELIDVEALDRALAQAFERKQARERLVQLGIERVAVMGLGLSTTEITGLVGGAAGPELGTALGDQVQTGLQSIQYGAVLLQTLEVQIEAQGDRATRIGATIGQAMLLGLKTTITPASTAQLVALFGPAFASWLASKDYIGTKR